MVQVCLNGSRSAAEGAVLPLPPEELARAAAQARLPLGQLVGAGRRSGRRTTPRPGRGRRGGHLVRHRRRGPVHGLTLGSRVLRVLAEVTDPDPATDEDSARSPLAGLGPAHGRPVLLHGEEGGTWPALRLAARLGRAARIGLEDTLFLPDGRRASGNAQLVAEGLLQYGSFQRSS